MVHNGAVIASRLLVFSDRKYFVVFLAIILHDFLSFFEETFLHRVSGDDSGDKSGEVALSARY